jgi:type VI secretion system protein ImpK
MSDDDLFAEPDDNEKTVIRPNPGGRRKSAPPNPALTPQDSSASLSAAAGVPNQTAATKSAKTSSDKSMSSGMTGMNKLNACATTLFALVSRIRNRAQHPDPNEMRRSVVAEVRNFENRALQENIDPQSVKVARYAICATLDDVVLNTPWGGTSDWTQQSMVGTFHRETVGGDRFYDLLARLEKSPGQNIDLLEFLYMCLSLGFEGRLRVEQNGADSHLNIRQGLARIIRTQRGEVETELSPHWIGLDKPHQALSAWKPFWIAVSVIAALLGTGFIGLSYALSNSTERVLGQLSVLNPRTVAILERRAPPVIIEPETIVDNDAQLKRISEFLKPEIDQGLVVVFQDANIITVRIKGKGMFGSASDSLKKAFKPLLSRIALALNTEVGPVIIAGHSDSTPINSARFKSNMQLSLARAETVRKTIAPLLKDANRLGAEGRADQEPIATNDTRDGQATNRRIEVLLIRENS